MKLDISTNVNTQPPVSLSAQFATGLQSWPDPHSNISHVLTLPANFSAQYWRKLDDSAGVSCRYAIDLPGCNPDEINISMNGLYLQVTAERSDTKTPICQQIAVDDCWDQKSAEADYEFAVVTVRFNRKSAIPPTKITLNVKP